MDIEDLTQRSPFLNGYLIRAIGFGGTSGGQREELTPEDVEQFRQNAEAKGGSMPVETHVCPECPRERGNTVVLVPGDGVIYVASQLLIHRVVAHGYRPPIQFVLALRALSGIGDIGWMSQILRLTLPLLAKKDGPMVEPGEEEEGLEPREEGDGLESTSGQKLVVARPRRGRRWRPRVA